MNEMLSLKNEIAVLISYQGFRYEKKSYFLKDTFLRGVEE